MCSAAAAAVAGSATARSTPQRSSPETLPDGRQAVSSGGAPMWTTGSRYDDARCRHATPRARVDARRTARAFTLRSSQTLHSAESPLTASDDEVHAVSSRGLRIGTATIESANSYLRRPVCGTTPRMNRSPTNVCRSPHHGHCLEWWSPRTSTRRCGPCWPHLRQRRVILGRERLVVADEALGATATRIVDCRLDLL